MNIDLHIEELVLRGFAPSNRHRIAESMQRELVRLLAGHGLPPGCDRNRESSRVDCGAFIARAIEKPESIGARIGQAVYGGMMGSQAPGGRRKK